MRTKEKPAAPRRGQAGYKINHLYFNQFKFTTTKNKCNPEISLVSEVKSYIVDLLAEQYFQGANTLAHRHAKLFWEKSGRRLLND